MNIAATWGRKLGLAHHVSARAAQWLGAYAAYADVRWAGIQRVVYVCAGNICRSAYGAARARALGLDAASFGLRAAPGVPADPVAIEVAARRGIDLREHRAASVDAWQPRPGDLLLAMEPRHARALVRRFGDAPPVSLLGIWVRPSRPHIEDPFGLGHLYFDTCFGIIDAATQHVHAALIDVPGRE